MLHQYSLANDDDYDVNDGDDQFLFHRHAFLSFDSKNVPTLLAIIRIYIHNT